VILLSVKHNKKQAGAQLCKAQDQLGLTAEAELLLSVAEIFQSCFQLQLLIWELHQLVWELQLLILELQLLIMGAAAELAKHHTTTHIRCDYN
jgi:hypothetical protein